ncbi:MAG: DUF2487 family protein [Thermoactinomyces sp.]
MRMEQLTPEKWKDVASYVDTLCVPVVSIQIREKEIMLKNSRLVQDFAEDLERKLGGRLLLLPSAIYLGIKEEVFRSCLDEIIKSMEQSGFYYLVFIIDEALKDVVKEMTEAGSVKILPYFVELPENPVQTEIDKARESLYQKVLEIWRQT